MTNRNAFAPRPLVKFRPLNEQSDEGLMKAIAAGNQAAMRTLYVRHHIRVYRFIVRLVTDTGRAEDLVSEVFIDVWGQAGRFEGRARTGAGTASLGEPPRSGKIDDDAGV